MIAGAYDWTDDMLKIVAIMIPGKNIDDVSTGLVVTGGDYNHKVQVQAPDTGCSYSLGRGGGQVVSVLTFYSNYPRINEKEAWAGQFY